MGASEETLDETLQKILRELLKSIRRRLAIQYLFKISNGFG
jgi:hypothetical protein